jgi:hypothetical protein
MSCLLVSPDIKSGLTDQISQRPSLTPAADSWPANQHVRMPLSGRDQQGSEAQSLSRAVRYQHDTSLASANSSQHSYSNTLLYSQSRHRITIRVLAPCFRWEQVLYRKVQGDRIMEGLETNSNIALPQSGGPSWGV